MADRIASDAGSVTTHRAHLARSGGTRLPCLRLPDDVDLTDGDEVLLVLDGERRHARVVGDASGLLVRGAYDNRRLLRESDTGEGENRLVEWCRAHGKGPDDAVDFDVVDPGHLYGLRVPGERAVYEVSKRPDRSLQDIADSLYDDG